MADLNQKAVFRKGLTGFILREWRILLIVFLGFLVYSNTFHASFHLDDSQNILYNPAIRNLGNLAAIWKFWSTRFITDLSFAFNYHFHQLRLPGYHITNLAIHLGAAVLFRWFVLLLFSTPVLREEKIAGHKELLALLAGLFFVAHPIQTQAVTYIVQRATSLAAFFYLLTFCLYAKARLIQSQRPDTRNWRKYYACSIMAALAALFTKESAMTLPFMLLVYEVSFFWNTPHPYPPPQRGRRGGGEIKRLAPFFIILAAALVIISVPGSVQLEKIKFLKEGQPGLTAITPSQYLFTQFRVIVTYVRLIFFPINQNLDYDYPIAQTLWQIPTVASLVFLLLLLTAGVLLFRKHRVLSFGIFWFFLALVPESSIIPIRDVIFEHRLYLPMAGYCIFLPAVAYYLFGDKKWKTASIILLAVIACYSVMTYTRNRVWKDEITLWSDVVKKSPNKARAYSNRGLAYSAAGEYAKAIADCNQAVKLGSLYVIRASVFSVMGKYDLAVADYTRAIALQPDYANAYFFRGQVYSQEKEYDRAIADFSQAIKFSPNFQMAYNGRGVVYCFKGEYDKAVPDFQAAIQTGLPGHDAYLNLMKIYEKEGAEDKLMELYAKMLNLQPDAEIYNKLGILYSKKGFLDQALREFKNAVELNPANGRFYNNLGIAYMQKGEQAEALKCWEKALQLAPDLKEARENLDRAERVNGRGTNTAK